MRGRRHEQGNQLEEDVLEETAQEKKLRLAKEYLARLESEGTWSKNCFVMKSLT